MRAWMRRWALLLFVLTSLGVTMSFVPGESRAGDYIVYVGTYTGGESEGIYRLKMNGQTGELTMLGVTGGVTNPSFLAIHPNGKYLYSVSEVADADGGSGGAISAFAIDPETHELTYLNHQSSGGAGPCHVTVAGNHVLSANYGGGSVCVHPIQEDGSLGEATAFVQHQGSSVDPARQEGPHAHSINVAANGTLAVCADLGLDQLLLYDLNGETGSLTPRNPAWVSLAPGAGPRHFAFHPNRQLAFAINELDSTITSFRLVENAGLFHPVQTISTLPHPVEGNSTADIHVHPTGKFVYGSNRVHNSIACFSLDQATGLLTLIEHESTQGEIPRNFAIDPAGRFLLAENQDSGTIVVFSINPETGELTPTGHSIEVPMPVCARFLPADGDTGWERVQLDARFRSEGSAAADLNKDGLMDVIAGDVWYAAPDWKVHEIRAPGDFVAGIGYSNSFVNWAYDINADGWTDVIIGGFPGAPFHWYENPKGEERHWTEHQIWTSFCNETPQFRDVTGDDRPDVVIGSQPEAQMGYLEIPTGDAVYENWTFHPISRPGDPAVNGTFMYYHGLGVTDVDGDGDNDVVIPHGWWKNPGNASEVAESWEFFEHRLSPAPDQGPLTGADIYAVDLDVDGDNDLVMSCAHSYGVWWFENIGDNDHSEFVYHVIDESYSQTHAMWFADVNEDGQEDMITGKRYFAHNGADPGAYEPVVMYWYELHPGEGGPEIIPHQILAGLDTGVGTQFTMLDFDGDGHLDIVLSNKKGVNLLLQRPDDRLPVNFN